MSTKGIRDAGGMVPTAKQFYIPAMPTPSAKAGRLERFVRGLDKGPRPERDE